MHTPWLIMCFVVHPSLLHRFFAPVPNAHSSFYNVVCTSFVSASFARFAPHAFCTLPTVWAIFVQPSSIICQTPLSIRLFINFFWSSPLIVIFQCLSFLLSYTDWFVSYYNLCRCAITDTFRVEVLSDDGSGWSRWRFLLPTYRLELEPWPLLSPPSHAIFINEGGIILLLLHIICRALHSF